MFRCRCLGVAVTCGTTLTVSLAQNSSPHIHENAIVTHSLHSLNVFTMKCLVLWHESIEKYLKIDGKRFRDMLQNNYDMHTHFIESLNVSLKIVWINICVGFWMRIDRCDVRQLLHMWYSHIQTMVKASWIAFGFGCSESGRNDQQQIEAERGKSVLCIRSVCSVHVVVRLTPANATTLLYIVWNVLHAKVKPLKARLHSQEKWMFHFTINIYSLVLALFQAHSTNGTTINMCSKNEVHIVSRMHGSIDSWCRIDNILYIVINNGLCFMRIHWFLSPWSLLLHNSMKLQYDKQKPVAFSLSGRTDDWNVLCVRLFAIFFQSVLYVKQSWPQLIGKNAVVGATLSLRCYFVKKQIELGFLFSRLFVIWRVTQ